MTTIDRLDVEDIRNGSSSARSFAPLWSITYVIPGGVATYNNVEIIDCGPGWLRFCHVAADLNHTVPFTQLISITREAS